MNPHETTPAETLEPVRAPLPFHLGVLAELQKEKIKTELLCLLFALVALGSLVLATIASAKGTEIMAIDSSGRTVKLEKLAYYEYWDSHIQSFALDFITLYFDKDPLAVRSNTEQALRMMTEQLKTQESSKAVGDIYSIMQSNTRALNEVRSIEADPQDKFSLTILAERTTRTMQKGSETEKKEIVKYRLRLAPEQRSIENKFKGLRVREFQVEVI